MPLKTPPATIGFHDFPRRGRVKKNAPEIPPRAQELIRLMTLGADDGTPPMTFDEAYQRMGIKKGTAAEYFRHPKARAYYLSLLAGLREREMAKNLATAVEIRDDAEMAKSAAGNRARVEAMKFIEGDHGPQGGVQVNVGVAISPGYVIDLSPIDREARRAEVRHLVEVDPSAADG